MNKKLVLRKIQNEFPEFQWNNSQYITGGCDHFIMIFDKKVVFRFPKESKYYAKFYDEINLLSYLNKKVKIGIPLYTFFHKNKPIAGYPIVNGREFKFSIFKKLSIFEKGKIAKQLADFLTILHSTPKAVIKKYHIVAENQRNMYTQLVKDSKKFIFPRFNSNEIYILENYFKELKSTLVHNYSRVLVHRDIIDTNILYDKKNEQINIIDFGDCVWADPALDFYGLFLYGELFTKKVIELYHGKKDKFLLKRAYLYFKIKPLLKMIGSFKTPHFPFSFKEGHSEFRKLFLK